MKINKILIIGYGKIGSVHLKLARTHYPKSSIYVLRSIGKLKPVNADGIFKNLKEAINFKPNLAVICNPSSEHIKFAIPFIRIGTHVMIEKPISNSFNEIKKIMKLKNLIKSQIFVLYNLRFLDSLIFFKKKINENLLGKKYVINCSVGQFLPDWHKGKDYKKFIYGKYELGGGPLLELSHEIDYLLWIFGECKWVYASINKLSNLKINVEDSVKITAEFVNKENKSIANIELDFFRHDHKRSCEVIGEKGTLTWNALTGKVYFFSINKKKWIKLYNKKTNIKQTYDLEWKYFKSNIKNKNLSYQNLENSYKIMNFIKSAKQSDLKNKKIQIN